MLLSLLSLVLRRSLGHWKLLIVVTVGVVIASALTASTAIYSDAIRDLGLSYALRQVPKLQLDVQVLMSTQSIRQSEYQQRHQYVLDAMYGYAGHYLSGTVEYGKSATFFPTAPGQPVSTDDQRPRAFFQYIDGLQQHARLVDGSFTLHTDPNKDPSQPPKVNVLVGKETADRLGVHVGDSWDMHPFWRNVPPITVVVAGIIQPNDLSEEYWFGTDPFAVTDTTWSTYPFFVDRDTMVNTIGAYLPDTSVDYTGYFFVNPGNIDARNATAAERGFRTAQASIEQTIPRTDFRTKLPDTISAFRQKLFFTRLPLFALIVQIVGIVLYYIVMVSTMLVDRQAGEIALLKSRGAGTRQILTVYAIEGLIIALFGLVLGPPLAALIIKVLGPTPPFHSLSGGHLLSTRVSVQAIELAGLGAGLSLLALLWPAYRACRLSIVQFKQNAARPPQAPAFMRYYLDVLLIAVGAVLFYELRERGSLVTQQLFGNLKADPLLLATPMLFTLMVALLFLRLFPLLLRVVVRLLGEVSGPSVLLGLWHIVRTPVHYTRLILLLILVTGIGMFASGFRATLDRSYADRAAYQAGADLRLQGIRQPLGLSATDLEARGKSATGATAASAALRVNASYSPKQFTSVDSSVLAIDPQTFGSVAYWRGDFSPHSLSSIDRTLQQNSLSQPAGIDLPDGARGLGVWVQTPTNSPGYQLAARLIDARGRVVDYGLFAGQNAQPAPGDWQFYVAPLDRPGIGISQRPGPAPTQPLRLLDVYIRDRPTQQEQTVTDYLQGLQITTDGTLQTGPDGFANGTPLDDFSNLSKFEAIPSEGNPDNADVLSKAPVQRAGQPAVQISWHRGQSDPGLHGFRLRGDGKPLMVYADSDFLNQTGLHTGSRAAMFIDDVTVETQIAGTFSYFPSFPADGRSHLLVVDLARLQAEVLRTPNPGNLVLPDELWLAGGGAGAADAQDLTSKGFTADTVLSLAQIRAGQQRDPLVAASWEGILFLSFAAVLVLAALGFAVYSYLTAQGRTLEFAVLRTMGLSHAQIAVVVAFEQAFVVATGIIAGTILGLPLSRVMIGFMGITETGDKVVPPMVGSVSWQAAAGAYAGLALVLIAVVASLVLLYGRLSVSRALRMGEV